MSLLDCFCASRTRVESLRPEKQSETSVHQYLVDEPDISSWSPPSARANEVICSTNVSHYELQVEIGRGFDNLTSVHLARHTPTGTLVTIKITNLENCTEERLKALQRAVILSHFFRLGLRRLGRREAGPGGHHGAGEGADRRGQRAGAAAEDDGQMFPEVHREARGLLGQL